MRRGQRVRGRRLRERKLRQLKREREAREVAQRREHGDMALRLGRHGRRQARAEGEPPGGGWGGRAERDGVPPA